jgi:predicted nucleic acid-binding protein
LTVFVDTSALFALVDVDDRRHLRAKQIFDQLLVRERSLTHSYVAVESEALARRRLGPDAARTLLLDLLPLPSMVWVDEELHLAGITAVVSAGSRRLSLVDCVSFELMRRERIDTAFAFDRHFAEQGFTTIP